MGTVRLDTIRNTIRQRCDIVSNNICTDTELNQWINDSGGELNGILAAAFGSKYNLARSSSFALMPGTDAYTITASPISVSNFLAMQRLEMLVGSQWLKVDEAKLSDFDRYQSSGVLAAGVPLIAWQFLGLQLLFVPTPQQAHTMRMYYTKTWTALSADSDTTDAVDGWHELIVLDCCIKAQIKQDLPWDGFFTQKQAMLKRLEEAKHHRNAANPVRITDTSGDDERWPIAR